jgi:ribonuclease-3
MVHRHALEPYRGHLLTAKTLKPVLSRVAGNDPLPDETLAFLTGLLDGTPPARIENWAAALTHGSFTATPNKGMARAADYQRLEFLGDRVLGLTIAQWLYETEAQDEGRLSQRLNVLVSRQTCAGIAREMNLAPHIRLGKQARDDGGADSDNILGDVMEALIGASFVESGFDVTSALVRRLWADTFGGKAGQSKHPKSALQEWAAGNRRRAPDYTLIDRSGPDHALHFTVAVVVKGVGEARATANSKQEAETKAASEFLRLYA